MQCCRVEVSPTEAASYNNTNGIWLMRLCICPPMCWKSWPWFEVLVAFLMYFLASKIFRHDSNKELIPLGLYFCTNTWQEGLLSCMYAFRVKNLLIMHIAENTASLLSGFATDLDHLWSLVVPDLQHFFSPTFTSRLRALIVAPWFEAEFQK